MPGSSRHEYFNKILCKIEGKTGPRFLKFFILWPNTPFVLFSVALFCGCVFFCDCVYSFMLFSCLRFFAATFFRITEKNTPEPGRNWRGKELTRQGIDGLTRLKFTTCILGPIFHSYGVHCYPYPFILPKSLSINSD